MEKNEKQFKDPFVSDYATRARRFFTGFMHDFKLPILCDHER